jgi:V-type H+-transporting ATPase subunit E
VRSPLSLWVVGALVHELTVCSAGGVSIIGGGGKIDIDNTFETRLKLLETSALPAVREALFGLNPNRKYRD